MLHTAKELDSLDSAFLFRNPFEPLGETTTSIKMCCMSFQKEEYLSSVWTSFFREKNLNITMQIEPQICLFKGAEVLGVLDHLECVPR